MMQDHIVSGDRGGSRPRSGPGSRDDAPLSPGFAGRNRGTFPMVQTLRPADAVACLRWRSRSMIRAILFACPLALAAGLMPAGVAAQEPMPAAAAPAAAPAPAPANVREPAAM